MAINKNPFIKKFNELDALCQSRFGGEGFSPMRKFAKTLNKDDSQTLTSLLSIRNTIHDKRELVSVKEEAIRFLDTIIWAWKNNSPWPIDVSLEELRRSNLLKMSRTLDFAREKIKILSAYDKEKIDEKMLSMINRERHVTCLADLKNIYFEFMRFCEEIPYLPCMQAKKNKKREEGQRRHKANLDRAKQEAAIEINLLYERFVAEMGFFEKLKYQKQLKRIADLYIKKAEACRHFDDIEDIVEDAESEMEDIINA